MNIEIIEPSVPKTKLRKTIIGLLFFQLLYGISRNTATSNNAIEIIWVIFFFDIL